MKRKKRSSAIVRRSVALPRPLVEEALRVSSEKGVVNVNGVVKTALAEYIERRRRTKFAEEMARMARDPDTRRECSKIAREFRRTESDGLSDD